MVIDKLGSLVGVRRHDYLPFGEEIGADLTWRTTGRGYVADAVRQKFTGYERDSETRLDYARARYFAFAQGRFTSPDPLLASGRAINPQTWNRYSYCLNNPSRLVDPTGMVADDPDEQARQQRIDQPPPPPPPQPPAGPPPIDSSLAGSPAYVQQHPIPAGIQVVVPDPRFVANDYFGGAYHTGVESVAIFTVVDDSGVPIDSPIWVREQVVGRLTVNGQPINVPVEQNPNFELIDNGFPDHIGPMKTTSTPVSQGEADRLQQVYANTSVSVVQTQTLTIVIPERGVMTVVNDRTVSNRPPVSTDGRGLPVPNYSVNVSIRSITLPSAAGRP